MRVGARAMMRTPQTKSDELSPVFRRQGHHRQERRVLGSRIVHDPTPVR